MIRAVIFDYGGVIRRRLLLQPELFEYAAQLRAEGYKTAVLSNIYSPITWILRRMGDLKDFDPVVYSSDIGVRKPSPQAYHAVLDKLDLKPQECIFVDNRPDNIQGAKKVGMQTVLDENTKQTIADVKQIIKTVQ
jgi:putative hydrolase of the HAD superfamily